MGKLAEIDDMARDQAAEAAALAKLQRARTAFVLGKKGSGGLDTLPATYAFFASLVLRFELVRADRVKTLATDGRRLFWALDYVTSLDADGDKALHQTVSELAHETAHAMLAHCARMADLLGPAPDPAKVRRAQVAGDCVVDPLLRDAGFWNPSFAVWPKSYGLPEGLAFEEYFRQLPDDAGQGKDGDGAGHGKILPAGADPNGQGADPADAAAQAAEWRVAVEQARRAAKMRGTLPAGLDALCDAVMRNAVDWRLVLREFFNQVARDDYSWTRPNRRHLHRGIYLPSCHVERLGRLVVVVDTSGSLSDGALAAGLGEVAAVLSERPMAVDLLLHDARCYARHTIDVAAGDTFPAIKTRRGGTSHRDSLEWIRDQADDAAAVLFFTDCESDLDAGPAPACPALFFKPDRCTTPAPAWAAAELMVPA